VKGIMYHYVRPPDSELPYFRHLDVDDFRRQLEYFASNEGVISRSSLLHSLATAEPLDGVILTFDDGFKDHVEYVLPALLEYGLWGIFYVPTGMHQTGKLLDVHRIHLLIGKHGGKAILTRLENMIMDDMLSHDHVEEFRSHTYTRQINDDATRSVKKILNYFISYDHREEVLDALMDEFFGNEEQLVADFYATPTEMKRLQDAGMIVGSHTVSHKVLSKLSAEEEARELADSFEFLEEATGGLEVRTFCYPYGGFHTFSKRTEDLLTSLGCRFSFNVEPRDIAAADLLRRPQALPRYDCNMFPHGQARKLPT
jgi:peptidoglycan/xylan/chitin deacetylase (PgdA/CDA1 family)